MEDNISKLQKFFIANPLNKGSYVNFGDMNFNFSGKTIELNVGKEYRYLSEKEIGELADFLTECKEHFKNKTVQKTRVVNISLEKHDVYIGRQVADFHFGNPFSHKYSSIAKIKVSSRKEAVISFRKWIKGQDYQTVEPERRQWILDNLHTLKGKALGCYCKPKECHGDIYMELLEPEIIGHY